MDAARVHPGRFVACSKQPATAVRGVTACNNSNDHAAGHRRRPWRLCRGDPRRPARHPDHAGGRRIAGRHLPEHRLHSVQGADPRRRRIRPGAAPQPATRRWASSVSAPTHRPRARPCAGRTASSTRLTTGVAALLKKNGVQVVKGWATIVDGKTVDVQPAQGEPLRIQCEHLLLATGSEPWSCRSLPFGGRVISSTEALAPDVRAEAAGRGRRRLHRAGAGHRLSQARRRSRVVEAQERILPAYDAELTQPVLATLQAASA